MGSRSTSRSKKNATTKKSLYLWNIWVNETHLREEIPEQAQRGTQVVEAFLPKVGIPHIVEAEALHHPRRSCPANQHIHYPEQKHSPEDLRVEVAMEKEEQRQQQSHGLEWLQVGSDSKANTPHQELDLLSPT